MKGFHFPSTRTTNSVRLILGTQYSLCENYNKRARLHWGLKQVLGTNLIPLRTKFDTQTKRVPAWPVINQLWFPERHFSASGISLRLGEVQMKFYDRSLQATAQAKRRFKYLSCINKNYWLIDWLIDWLSSPFPCPPRLRRSLARSRETRFTRPNRRACSQAMVKNDRLSLYELHVNLLIGLWRHEAG